MELQPQHQDDSQRSLLVLFVLMAFIILWTTFLMPRRAPTDQGKDTGEQTDTESTEDDASEKTKAKTTEIAEAKTAKTKTPPVAKTKTKTKPKARPKTDTRTKREEYKPQPERESPPLVCRSKRFRAIFTNENAALKTLTLLDSFRDPPSQAAARKALEADEDADVSPYGLPLLGQKGLNPSFVIADRPDADKVKGSPEAELLATPLFESRHFKIEKDQCTERKVVFSTTIADGQIRVTKTFELPDPEGDEHKQRHVVVEIQIENTSDKALVLPGYRLIGPGGLAADVGPRSWKRRRADAGQGIAPTESEQKDASSWLSAAVAMRKGDGDADIQSITCSKLQDRDFSHNEMPVLWAATRSNYFAAILEAVPDEDQEPWVWAGGAEAAGDYNLSAHLDAKKLILQPKGKPGSSVVHRYQLYAGPKNRDVLQAYGSHFDKVIQPSRIWFLRDPMAWILRTASRLVHNYGVAIIILTLIVRLVMHPLTKKSQTSMQRMQKLQPKMKEVQEKYKNDKRRQQEEMMKLYREYGVNPFGGCLPILLQLPIFIGLYWTLRESIDLRHAPFVLWMEDLSQPDALFGLVNVLPVLCCVIMFVQQRSMPKPPDPQQAQTQKIMSFMMPGMLLFFFYSIPSGVSLYFSVSTIIGILEQKRIRRHIDKMGDLKPVRKPPDKKGSGPSARPRARPKPKRKVF